MKTDRRAQTKTKAERMYVCTYVHVGVENRHQDQAWVLLLRCYPLYI